MACSEAWGYLPSPLVSTVDLGSGRQTQTVRLPDGAFTH